MVPSWFWEQDAEVRILSPRPTAPAAPRPARNHHAPEGSPKMIPAAELPPIIASRYRPLRLIATGGMGAVYEVEHVRPGEHLALKIMLAGVGASAADVERFKREARACARIESEHVVRVTDADAASEIGGAFFFVMELLEGMTLERAATVALPAPGVVIAWLRQVAQAVDEAHHLGIVHRDLKPENLFL